eukprot:m.258191 g.258191  ORF g.258191 m.258191 type:complete len:87 (+) comp19186_c0_seq8:396-656(+)
MRFAVARLRDGCAVLLSDDHLQVELPLPLLPKGTTVGSFVELSVTPSEPLIQSEQIATLVALQQHVLGLAQEDEAAAENVSAGDQA